MTLKHLYLDSMKLKTLLGDVKVRRLTGRAEIEISGVVCDSRLVRQGYLFAALPGLKSDGMRHVREAVTRGAAAILAEQAPAADAAGAVWVQVADARRALAEVACAFYEYPANYLQMVGITGTNGKTTTAHLTREILAAAGRTPGLLGTVSYEIGQRVIPAVRTTPEVPDLQGYLRQMLVAGCRSAVMEVSSHALAQQRVWGVDYDVGVFTNLTEEHLDYHETMEEYFSAKARLFHGLGQRAKRAVAVLNLDDEWGRRLQGVMHARVQEIGYGVCPGAQVRAADIRLKPGGASAFRLVTPWGGEQVDLRLPGSYNISNALAACAACGALGVDTRVMADVLARTSGAPGRMELVPNTRGLHVYVDYAHTPDALKKALGMLREQADGRLLVVFGCGGDRDCGKRPVMGAIATHLADYVIVTTDNARTEDPAEIAGDVMAGAVKQGGIEMILDRQEAITRAVRLARPGDVVLVAGKGHEAFQEIGRAVIPFDDREAVRTALAESRQE